MSIPRRSVVLILVLAVCAVTAGTQPEPPAIRYRLTFPEPEHRWMQVEATFGGLGTPPLQVRMSRSSPGRYALHEFAKNVFDVRAFDGAGAPLSLAHPDPHRWDVAGHDGTVRIVYKVYGDRVDGTYLAIDATHAHINMPAALMWARGLEDRRAEVRLEPPRGAAWTVATELYPTKDPAVFAAPNLQYLMDSPAEFGPIATRTFTLGDEAGRTPAFRIAVHHRGTDAELDRFAADVEKIVREERPIFGEYAPYDTGTYTFLADYLPYASGDGMEHRNSTVLTAPAELGDSGDRKGVLETVAHEFFHSWNVERIRPRALEPFNFDEANVSGELWLAEGFTSYYQVLVTHRAGLTTLTDALSDFAGLVNTVTLSPGRRFRSAEEMSQLAPLVDAAAAVDRTSWDNTFISYYTWGAAIGLGLDLELRDRTGGRVSLDDYMRAMWTRHGKPGGRAPGLVDAPYTMADARARLAEVSGDPAFAADFFARFIQGRDVVDYRRLLARAGLVVRPRQPGRPWLGDLRLDFSGGSATVSAAVPFGSPASAAGLERDDRLVSLDGAAVTSFDRVEAVLRRRRPGDQVAVSFERRGAPVTSSMTIADDPRIEIVDLESTGATPTAAQRAFRSAWLGSRVRW